jgi:DNA-binding MarR family transcriptional regulator
MADLGTATHRDLLTQIRDVLTAIRVFKNQPQPYANAVPAGTFGVLVSIATGDGSHVKELATACALDPSTVSRAAATLVGAGLVERTADPDDGRASVLTVSAAGRSALDDVLTHYERRLAAALRDWSPEELAAFTAMSRRFAHDLMTLHHPHVSHHPHTSHHRHTLHHPHTLQEAAR